MFCQVMLSYVTLCYYAIWCYVVNCYDISMSNEVDLWIHEFKSGDIQVVLDGIFVLFVRMPYMSFIASTYFMNSYIDIIVVISSEIMVEGFILNIMNIQTLRLNSFGKTGETPSICFCQPAFYTNHVGWCWFQFPAWSLAEGAWWGFWPFFVAGRRANHTWQMLRMRPQRMTSLKMGPWLWINQKKKLNCFKMWRCGDVVRNPIAVV